MADGERAAAAAVPAAASADAAQMIERTPAAAVPGPGVPTASSTFAETAPAGIAPPRQTIYRHSLVVRLTHWANALFLTLLLMSGLCIFNYHPALYWGNYGYRGVPSFLSISALDDIETDEPVGVTTIAGYHFITTGVLGVSYDADGEPVGAAFPRWMTLPGGPGLALARDWHFAAAWLFVLNGLAYLMFSLASGHLRRDLLPTRRELGARHLLASVWDHLRLRRARGEEARRYNVLQKLAYVSVVLVLLPLMALTGFTMSPAITAAAPFLFDVFGGRQTARTIHFLAANLIVLFVLVHIIQVFAAGAFNAMRSMVTGRYAIRPEKTL